MTPRALSWLTTAPLLLWALPTIAKKASPEHFGGAEIQWTCAVINAVLVPVVFLIGLKLLATDERRKAGLGCVFCAALPLVANLAIQGVGSAVMARAQGLLAMPMPKEQVAMSRLIDGARERETAGERKKAAGLAYEWWGIAPVWRDDAGELAVYKPDANDEARRARTVETDRTLHATLRMLDGQLRQSPWLFALNLGSFVVITFAGLAWHAFLGKPGMTRA